MFAIHYLIQVSQQLWKINPLLFSFHRCGKLPEITQVSKRQSQDSNPGPPDLRGQSPCLAPQAGLLGANSERRGLHLSLHWKRHRVHITDSKSPPRRFSAHYTTSECYISIRHQGFKYIDGREWRETTCTEHWEKQLVILNLEHSSWKFNRMF